LASIRIILLTCRRTPLLRRALASLLAQTRTDWVCELHNDAPEDESPRALLAEMAPGDPRFSYHHHAPAWGPVRSFNHCFRAGPEPLISLLEDDNWWEPGLLEALSAALARNPTATLAWANMRVWQEDKDSSWTDTGRTVWPIREGDMVFDWPVLIQAFDGLHSNGAMLFRSAGDGRGAVPDETPFALIEPVRERSLRGPYVLVGQALAHYALTRSTARSRDRTLWVQGQLLLAGSFLESVELTPGAWDELWATFRCATPRRTGALLMVALAGIRRREILSRARPSDMFEFVANFVGSLGANLSGLSFRTSHAALWAWLRRETAERTREAREAGRDTLAAGSLISKSDAEGKPH
jgi:hypothetical protein